MITAQPGRNDPCPCGSGSKYKKCCADADSRRERSLRLIGPEASIASPRGARGGSTATSDPAMREALRAAAREGDWQVDAVPLNIVVEEALDERPVGVLVVASGFVLDAEIVRMRSAEPEEVARVLAGRIAAAAGATGHWPDRVQVRHEIVASPLGSALAEREVEVLVRPELGELDDAAGSLGSHLGSQGDDGHDRRAARASASTRQPSGREGAARPMISSPERWAAWGLPPELVGQLFAAAARFHAARPWTNLRNTESLEVVGPGGDEWTACVMGNAGQQFGLILYSDAEDFVRLLESDEDAPSAGWVAPRGSVVTLSFERRDELRRGMHREISRAGWPIAGPDAYPVLWCMNTPGGGIPRAWATTLALALDAVASFTREHEDVLATHVRPERPLKWFDGETGISLAFFGDALDDATALWIPASTWSPAGAVGPGADPGDISVRIDAPEAMLERDRAVVDEFERWLVRGGTGRRPVTQGTATLHAMIAGAFVDCLGGNGAGLGAVHEFDLRVFMYEWFPRKVRMARTEAMRAPVSLARFLDFLAAEKGIVCPWGKPILDDRATYAARWDSFPGGHWWDDEVRDWCAEVTDDLDHRGFLPAADLAGVGAWGQRMGIEEARLHYELSRLWLRWRDEIIRSGVTEPAEVRRLLVQRQRAWELAPHGGRGSRTPSEMVRRERAERGSE